LNVASCLRLFAFIFSSFSGLIYPNSLAFYSLTTGPIFGGHLRLQILAGTVHSAGQQSRSETP
jgi:hypothetical protein